MKKIHLLFVAVSLLLLAAGCTVDLDSINGRLDDLGDRVEALEEQCGRMNTDIVALGEIVTALQVGDCITEIVPVTGDDGISGYEIHFAKSGTVIIYNGSDGADGTDGQDGADGIDGDTPQVGVRKDADGKYYWTLNGEWLLDGNGNKIPVRGSDGSDGSDGQDGENGSEGQDGVTPEFKIEDGYWYISYDGGQTWTRLGKADGEDGQNVGGGSSIFADVEDGEYVVVFTLADGTVIEVPKWTDLQILFSEEDLVLMDPNSSIDISYGIVSFSEAVEVEVFSSADIKAMAVPDAGSPLRGVIRVETGPVIDEYSKVVVLVSDGVSVLMRTISFEESHLSVSGDSVIDVGENGGTVQLYYMSNMDCEVSLGTDARGWVDVVETKAVAEHSVTLSVASNSGGLRTGTVIVGDPEGLNITYIISQDGSLYTSSDYSADGVVELLQAASAGEGIDIVLMGDAYTDRLIADGTYRSVMENTMEQFFSEEPYRSFREYFNVYMVYVVSPNGEYSYQSTTALDTYFGQEGTTLVGGYDEMVMQYALNAISSDRMDEALLVVMMNRDYYAGTCYMYYPEYGDYGNGVSVAYFPTSSNAETFRGLILHEAGGHGFSKLADEYAYQQYGEIPSSEVEACRNLETFGWYRNIDFTPDENQVKWSRFIADSRYQYDGLGAFEGGNTYWTGVWRPTENSIMRYNDGGFNAPSREAIYIRIHKLAYGEDWQYDYESFVAYDEVNRRTEPAAAAHSGVTRMYEPTVPPVVIGKTWREAMEDEGIQIL